jgi:hypothetical protein
MIIIYVSAAAVVICGCAPLMRRACADDRCTLPTPALLATRKARPHAGD